MKDIRLLSTTSQEALQKNLSVYLNEGYEIIATAPSPDGGLVILVKEMEGEAKDE